MSRRLQELEKPQVRKPLLIIGGAAVGAAILGFVLLNFVFGGDNGSGEPTTPQTSGAPVLTQPSPLSEATHAPLHQGGRDPFVLTSAVGNTSAAGASAAVATPSPTVAPTPAVPAHETVEVLSTTEGSANVRVNGKTTKGAKPGTAVSPDIKVHSVVSPCVFFDQGPKTFRVCEGEKYVT